jgi:hypothetical protein
MARKVGTRFTCSTRSFGQDFATDSHWKYPNSRTIMQHDGGMIVNPNIDRATLPSSRSKRFGSKITVPAKAHPFARLVFAEMKRQNMTHDEMEHLSGVLRCTIKAWRTDNTPGLTSISATLGALGWALVPVPILDELPDDVSQALADIGQHFRSDQETYGAALQAAAAFPKYSRERVGRPRSYASKPEGPAA